MSEVVEHSPIEPQSSINPVPVWRQFWDQNPEPEAIRYWTKGLTPGLIGAALWLPWLDGLAAGSLPFGGVRHSFFGAIAGVVAVLPLFFILAFIVRSQDRPLRQIMAGVIGSKTGSKSGALAVLVTHGLLALIILAVAIDTGAKWYFQTLEFTGLLETKPSTFVQYLTTTIWALWVIPIGYGMVRIIAALLDYVPILIAAVLSLLFIMALRKLQLGEPSLVFPVETIANPSKAFWHGFQWTFCFGLIISIFAADWGMGLKRNSDILLGGFVGLGLGLLVVLSIGLFTIAAYGMPSQPVPTMFDVLTQTGRWPTLVCGLLIGTYAAAPGVFASYHLLQDLRQVFPKVHHWAWLVVKIVFVQFGIFLIRNRI